MADPGPTNTDAEQRPHKRVKSTAPLERGPDLNADALLKYRLKFPDDFTSGSIQANRVALRVHNGVCKAFVANAQHVYEVSLGVDFVGPGTGLSATSAADKGKEGVLIPHSSQVGHIRQVEQLSDMAAEIQCLSSGDYGGFHVLAAVDAIGNARLLASTAAPGAEAEAGTLPAGRADDGDSGRAQHVLELPARTRGECGWVGLAMRALSPSADAGRGGGAEGGEQGRDEGGGGKDGVSGPPPLEVAVARQRMRDVSIFREGRLVRTLHTLQGPSAMTYLPPGSYGGCTDASSGLLVVAEDHQVVLWDLRQGERGGCCVQRLNVYGGGFPVYGLSWVPGVGARQQSGAGGGDGLLAVTGGERSVVMIEPRKWHVAAKWPGCVKYPATHLLRSAVAPGFVYAAGLDYECVAGRWDGTCGGSSGNANSSSGGHGRAVGPVHLLGGRERDAAADDGPETTGGRGGLSFRGDSKWLGMASVRLPGFRTTTTPGGSAVNKGAESTGPEREVVAALSLSGHLYVLIASASTGSGATPLPAPAP